MPGLETAFYIVGIVFMGLSLLILIAIVIAVFVIRNKVVSLERTVQEKVHNVTQNVEKAIEVAKAIRNVAKAAKK